MSETIDLTGAKTLTGAPLAPAQTLDPVIDVSASRPAEVGFVPSQRQPPPKQLGPATGPIAPTSADRERMESLVDPMRDIEGNVRQVPVEATPRYAPASRPEIPFVDLRGAVSAGTGAPIGESVAPELNARIAELQDRYQERLINLGVPKEEAIERSRQQQDTNAFTRYFGDPQARAKGEIDSLQNKIIDADIDYTSGGPFAALRALKAAKHDPNSVRLELGKLYPPGQFGQDTSGNWWVNVNGKRTAVEQGQGILSTIGAEIAGRPATFLGQMAGTAAGSRAGPTGMNLGAVAGTYAGSLIDDAARYLLGTTSMDAGQMAHAANDEALTTALINSPFYLAGQAGRAWQRHGLKVTPELSALNQRMLDQKAVPLPQAALPGGTGITAQAGVAHMIHGDPALQGRIEFVAKQLDEYLTMIGMPQADRTTFLAALAKGQKVDLGPIGVGIGKEVAEANARRQLYLDNDIASILEVLQRDRNLLAEGALGKLTKDSKGLYGQNVAPEIVERFRELRSELSNKFDRLYTKVDAMTGGAQFIPGRKLQETARELVNSYLASKLIPPQQLLKIAGTDATGKALANSTPAYSIMDLQNLRAFLNQAVWNEGLAPDVTKHYIYQLRGQANDLLALAPKLDFPNAAKASAALIKVNNAYGSAISPFNNPLMTKWIRDAQDRIFPNPAVFVGSLFDTNSLEQSRKLFSMMPKELKEQVVAIHLQDLLKIGRFATPYHPEIMAEMGYRGRMPQILNGERFLAIIRDQEDAIKALYPSGLANKLLRYAEDYARVGAKLDANSLRDMKPGDLLTALQNAIAQKEQFNTWANNNVIAALLSRDAQGLYDSGIDAVIARRNAASLPVVAEALGGVASPEWKRVQQAALVRLFEDSTQSMERQLAILGKTRALNDGDFYTIGSTSFINSLRNLSDNQVKYLIPGGTRQDLENLSKLITHTFPEYSATKGLALSQAAQSIMQKVGPNILNPRTAAADLRWMHKGMIAYLLSRPNVMQFLGTIRDVADPSVGTQIFRLLQNYVARSASGNESNVIDPNMVVRFEDWDRKAATAP